jgi:hypothetical protein
MIFSIYLDITPPYMEEQLYSLAQAYLFLVVVEAHEIKWSI